MTRLPCSVNDVAVTGKMVVCGSVGVIMLCLHFHQVLTEKARSGSLLAAECEGGTFT